MRRTFGYHVVFSCYGQWLPGDQRGHWSEAWDEQLGLVEPRQLHPGDPVRRRMALERTKHLPVRLTAPLLTVVETTLAACQETADWRLAAAALEPTHVHLLLTPTAREIDDVTRWLKEQLTKAIHRQTDHSGPVWCKGSWRQFVFDETAWLAIRRYIERHNERRGLGPRPYSFLT